MKQQQLGFIGIIVSLAIRLLYVVAIVIISFLPVKKLKLIVLLEPDKVFYSKRNFYVSTEEIGRRVREACNSSLDSATWLDRREYEDKLIEIHDMEQFCNNYHVYYADFAYEYEAEGRWDRDEIWLMLKDRYEEVIYKCEESREFLTAEIKERSTQTLNYCYCTLCYWPYAASNEFSMTDDQIAKAKDFLQRQANL